MTSEELRNRTMRFAVRVVRFCRRSRAEFIAKLGVVVEEADESVGWLELIGQVDLARGPEFVWLLGEANELLASSVSLKRRRRRTVGGASPLIN